MALGQAINLNKSKTFYSSNDDDARQNTILDILGVHTRIGTGKYLDIPSIIVRNRKDTFSFIKNKVWKKINSGKFLSKVGCKVMSKAVLQDILTYVMRAYLLPKLFTVDLECMLNFYWWGTNGKGVKWMRQEKLTVQKELGGMNFRDLFDFNLALLGKQGWRFISLRSQIFP